MLDYTYAEIEKAVRGKLVAPTRRGRFKGDVSLDTRTIKEGDLFIPLKGPNFDGHAYIDEAFQKGARLCFAETNSRTRVGRKQADVIFVEDTLVALGRLAAFHRRRFQIPVIAITGSCGKTTTKDLTAHFLSRRFKVLKNEGTENNFVGVPKTLLRLADHEAAVIEIGTNRGGEIRYLSRIVNPTHAVITVIGNAHLTGFRNVEGVRGEKLSLLESLEKGSPFIYNGDDKNIADPRMKPLKKIRAGFSPQYDFYADRVELDPQGTKFRFNGKEMIETSLLGKHNVLNVLLAAGAACSAGLPKKDIKEAAATFAPPKGRVRYQEINGVAWIDDSYNSNPTSLKAAIELFKSYPLDGRKILVLGDMLELGRRADVFHRDAGESIAGYPFDMVLTVGELSKEIARGAVEKGFKRDKIKSFGTSEEAGRYLKGVLKSRDAVLLKGSRGMRMEKVLESCS